MTQILSALGPVFLLILLGYGVRRGGFVGEGFWASAEKLTYYLFFPALLVSNTAAAELGGIQVLPMAVVLVGAIVLVSGILLVARRRLEIPGPRFTSLFQGSFRPNTYVAIAAAFSLFGEAGLTLIAIAIVIVVPTVNVLSVAAFSRFVPLEGAQGVWRTLGPVVRNPLILACLLGVLLNAGGVGLPPLVGPLLEILGRAALPIGLLAVGAGLDLAAARSAGPTVAVAALCKLVVLPLLTFALCKAAGVSGLTATVCVMYAAAPGSPSSYVLARQMGGDSQLMAAIITVTTLGAMAALPLALLLAAN